ncbi:MAG TPA: hypothetical protein VEC02_07525 [Nitrososphaerales archaeon]|nr:hypothetical protein [Nitrososphaerales archaeon]
MRVWIPLAFVLFLVIASVALYAVTSAETQRASSVGLANIAGLMLVFVGVIAALLIMRRARPPGEPSS